jgi:hypothetical protein
MNVAGAALATIISQFVSCIWVLSFLFGKKTIIKIRKEYLLFDKNIMNLYIKEVAKKKDLDVEKLSSFSENTNVATAILKEFERLYLS